MIPANASIATERNKTPRGRLHASSSSIVPQVNQINRLRCSCASCVAACSSCCGHERSARCSTMWKRSCVRRARARVDPSHAQRNATQRGRTRTKKRLDGQRGKRAMRFTVALHNSATGALLAAIPPRPRERCNPIGMHPSQ